MDQRILDFLNKERVCALATILPDGSPHSAAMHFFIEPEPLAIYFLTNITSRKGGLLEKDGRCRSSIVLGFDEKEMLELQMDGDLEVVGTANNNERLKKLDLVKNPHHEKFFSDPKHVFLKFIPAWWRYTEFKAKPAVKISSEDK